MIKPLFDRIVVDLVDPPSVTASGLVLVSNNQSSCLYGVVKAVPVAFEDGGDDIKVGDTIAFDKEAYPTVVSDAGKYCVVRVKNVIGVM